MQPKHLTFQFYFFTIIFLLAYQIWLQLYFNENFLYNLICDDAFISLVYAKNFANGHGFIYNFGEKVEGYTNFLWTLIMSIPFFFKRDPILFIKLAGSLSCIFFSLFIYSLAKSIVNRQIATLTVAAVALNNQIAYMSSWGLETIFYIMLYTAAIFFTQKRFLIIGGSLFAFSAMTRMEAVLVYGVFFLYLLHISITKKKYIDALKFLGSFSAIFLPYFILRYFYYGYLLPNTFYAKVSSSGKKTDLLIRGVEYIYTQLSNLKILSVALCAIFISILYCALYKKIKNKLDTLFFPIFFSLLIYLAYIIYVGGDVFQERFIIHTLPLLLLTIIFSIQLLSALIPIKNNLICSFLFIPVVFGLGTADIHNVPSTHLTGWKLIGDLFSKDTDIRVIATDAAGAIKYYSHKKVLDILGLNDTHIAHKDVALGSGVPGHEKQDNHYILNNSPDAITTWIDPDGGAGRAFDNYFQFRSQYNLTYLLDTSRKEILDSRLHKVDISGGEKCAVLAHLGSEKLSGVYDWGVWTKHKLPSYRIDLNQNDFFSNIKKISCENDSIIFLDQYNNGIFLYGPYMVLNEGNYVLKFTGELSQCIAENSNSVVFDVFNGKETIKNFQLDSQKQTFEVNINFSVDRQSASQEDKYEFRIYSNGNCFIKIKNASLSKESVMQNSSLAAKKR